MSGNAARHPAVDRKLTLRFTFYVSRFTMVWLNPVLILLAAFLAVFWEAAFPGVRHILGAQIDLLPCLMVYAALRASLITVSLLAFFGGLCFDSLSANPLGIT